MLVFRLTISSPLRKELDQALKTAQRLGDIRLTKRLLAILAIADGQPPEQVALLLRVSLASHKHWQLMFVCYKLNGLKDKKPQGRKPKLSKSQKRQLPSFIDAGPQVAGFSSAC